VRELPEDEQLARTTAATVWNSQYSARGEAALLEPPAAVDAVLQNCLQEEGSSSEDTSDEAYAAMHRIMEDDEHRRYAAVVAEGQRKRANQGATKTGQQVRRRMSREGRGGRRGVLASMPVARLCSASTRDAVVPLFC
jgi:hypothetical protein